MKVGDLVRQKLEGQAPAGAVGLIIDKDERQTTGIPRWTIRWFIGNEMWTGHTLSETTGYGYGIEVVSESR